MLGEKLMVKAARPKSLQGTTYQAKTGCGPIYVVCNVQDSKLFEVFLKLGKSGGCGSATMEAVARLISIGLRSGTDAVDIIGTLAGIQCHRTPSCLDVIAECIRSHEGDE